MTDNSYSDLLGDDQDIQSQEQNDGPKALREALKKEAQRRKELEAELNAVRTKQREVEVKEKLKAAGLPEGAAKFAAGAEDVEAWINENRGLFGAAGSVDTPEDQRTPVGDAAISPEDQSAMQLVQGVQPGAFNPGTRNKLVQDIQSASTEAELNQLLRAQGLLK